MPGKISIRFLGTSSQPSASRNYSSLLVKLDREAVMVDCGESTQRQLANRHIGGEDKLSNIHKILITHLHADHCLGLVPLLYSMMGPSSPPLPANQPRVEIFGPLGLRALIRTQLSLCYTSLEGKYVVNELRWRQQASSSSSEQPGAFLETESPLLGAVNGPRRTIPELPLHESELPGKDIFLNEESASWQDFTTVEGVSISAAPVLHRCPTVGYVFREPPQAAPLPKDTFQRLDANAEQLLQQRGIKNPRSLVGRLLNQRESIQLPDGTTMDPPPLDVPGRKICVCGDTSDATGGLSDDVGLVALAQGADLLVHESTNAALPPHLSSSKTVQTLEEVRERAAGRGHSIPQGAGAFAGKIRASSLILNHFSVRYAAPSHRSRLSASYGQDGVPYGSDGTPDRNAAVMQCIADQATEAWHASMPADDPPDAPWRSQKAIASWDGLTHDVLRADQQQRRREEGAIAQQHPSRTHHRFDADSNGIASTHQATNGTHRGGHGLRGSKHGTDSHRGRTGRGRGAPYSKPSST